MTEPCPRCAAPARRQGFILFCTTCGWPAPPMPAERIMYLCIRDQKSFWAAHEDAAFQWVHTFPDGTVLRSDGRYVVRP
jgi:hypothetical protein